jgi:hypothetical protein
MWMFGWGDTNGNCGWIPAEGGATAATVYLHGNYDIVTGAVVWNPTNANHNLPNSLYLSSKPSFFGSNTWPWVDPVTPNLYTLPARARFSAVHGLSY